MLQPYIMKIERHTTEKDVDEKKEYKTMKYYRYKFVPYIRKKNGDIIPLDHDIFVFCNLINNINCNFIL